MKDVPVAQIDSFLRDYRADPANPPIDPLTDPNLIRDYIDARASSELASWDVFVASSTRSTLAPITFAPLDLVPSERTVDSKDYARGILSISGSSRRVGSAEDELEGLSEDEIVMAREAYRNSRSDKTLPKTVSPRIYRTVPGRNPLLILRLVRPKLRSEDGEIKTRGDILTWGLSFPSSQVESGLVSYVVNTVRMRELFGEDEIEEEALGDAE